MNRNEAMTHLAKEDFYKGGHPLCPGCTGGTFWRLVTKVMGKDSIACVGSTCVGLPIGLQPSALCLPSISVSMATPGPLITGTSAGLRALKRKGKLPQGRQINVFCVAGDGGTADIGFAGVSGAAERNDDGVYFCFDNEAYMNTGIQRSSQTPAGGWTTTTLDGKPQAKKDMPAIMAAHGIPYVATACISFPEDLIGKTLKAKEMRGGFRYLHVLGPCPTGWRFPEREAIKIGRLAVDCGIWLLYEVDHGEFRLTYRPRRRKPVKEYLSGQGRFSHLTAEEIDAIQAEVDRKCAKYGF
jgi:pyruvate ferredoxin oxidoreductase beta subunit